MAKATLDTRLPADALKPLDFEIFPVWEFAHDEEERPGMEEIAVRPVVRPYLTPGLREQLVRATFTTPRDETLSGFMFVSTTRRTPLVEPGAILFDKTYLHIPEFSRADAVAAGHDWDLDHRRAILKKLHRREESVFPLSYQLHVPVGKRGKLIRGKIP